MSSIAIATLNTLLARLQSAPPRVPRNPEESRDSEYDARVVREDALKQRYICLLEAIVDRARERLPAGEALANLERWNKEHPGLYFVRYPKHY